MKFTKMHGIGNDFVVINGLVEQIAEADYPAVSKKLCDRKFGVGGDGIILVLPSKLADFKMRMFNPDGSEAEMCGNGIRVFARDVYDRQMISDQSLKVETKAGVKALKLTIKRNEVEAVRVDMGVPRLNRSDLEMTGEEGPVVSETLKAEGRKFEITGVSMGNPHVVIFEDNLESLPLQRFGSAIETHKSFPRRTNVHFVKVVSTSEIVVRTWERGAGETLACGTGACACVVACVLNNKTGRSVDVHLPGGDLHIEWNGDDRVMMTGPATEVFEGEIAL